MVSNRFDGSKTTTLPTTFGTSLIIYSLSPLLNTMANPQLSTARRMNRPTSRAASLPNLQGNTSPPFVTPNCPSRSSTNAAADGPTLGINHLRVALCEAARSRDAISNYLSSSSERDDTKKLDPIQLHLQQPCLKHMLKRYDNSSFVRGLLL